MIDIIKEYHTPDQIWSIWKSSSYEDYLRNFLITGKFHKNVPTEIINDYKIVERLLCYAYYHYPLLDEALSKATRIFEASINKRIEDLNLSKSKGFETLEKKIKKIEPFTTSSLLEEWNKARRVRNICAHQNTGTLMGITVVKSFYQIVNIINTIFLNKTIVVENELGLKQLQDKSEHLKEGLFELNINNKHFLIWSIIPYSFFKTDDIEKSLWVFHPVLTNFPQNTDTLVFSSPICLYLDSIEISKDSFTAKLLNNGKKVEATRVNDYYYINLLDRHNKLISSAEDRVHEIYIDHLDTEIAFERVKFLYNECWQAQNNDNRF